ncbi:unnamed protein product [Amoebophrya sp. A120]|nr:unnamed protein product [Amoebophrya sp. A120]|eukprot:GSA120T00004694001.1
MVVIPDLLGPTAAFLAAQVGWEGLKDVFQYNRSLYQFDASMAQATQNQRFFARKEWIWLYREDIANLVGLTTQKMSLYTLFITIQLAFVGGMFVDSSMLKAVVVIWQGPNKPILDLQLRTDTTIPLFPTSLIFPFALSLTSAILFSLLALYFAIFATVVANTCGTTLSLQSRILRDIPTGSEIDAARRNLQDFEQRALAAPQTSGDQEGGKQAPATLFRLPFSDRFLRGFPQVQSLFGRQKRAFYLQADPLEHYYLNEYLEEQARKQVLEDRAAGRGEVDDGTGRIFDSANNRIDAKNAPTTTVKDRAPARGEGEMRTTSDVDVEGTTTLEQQHDNEKEARPPAGPSSHVAAALPRRRPEGEVVRLAGRDRYHLNDPSHAMTGAEILRRTRVDEEENLAQGRTQVYLRPIDFDLAQQRDDEAVDAGSFFPGRTLPGRGRVGGEKQHEMRTPEENYAEENREDQDHGKDKQPNIINGGPSGAGGNTAAGGSSAATPTDEFLIRVSHLDQYRGLQRHWQVYDSYCRITMLLSTVATLQSLTLWVLGFAIQKSPWLCLAVSFVFMLAAGVITKLDLSAPRGWHLLLDLAVWGQILATGLGSFFESRVFMDSNGLARTMPETQGLLRDADSVFLSEDAYAQQSQEIFLELFWALSWERRNWILFGKVTAQGFFFLVFFLLTQPPVNPLAKKHLERDEQGRPLRMVRSELLLPTRVRSVAFLDVLAWKPARQILKHAELHEEIPKGVGKNKNFYQENINKAQLMKNQDPASDEDAADTSSTSAGDESVAGTRGRCRNNRKNSTTRPSANTSSSSCDEDHLFDIQDVDPQPDRLLQDPLPLAQEHQQRKMLNRNYPQGLQQDELERRQQVQVGATGHATGKTDGADDAATVSAAVHISEEEMYMIGLIHSVLQRAEEEAGYLLRLYYHEDEGYHSSSTAGNVERKNLQENNKDDIVQHGWSLFSTASEDSYSKKYTHVKLFLDLQRRAGTVRKAMLQNRELAKQQEELSLREGGQAALVGGSRSAAAARMKHGGRDGLEQEEAVNGRSAVLSNSKSMSKSKKLPKLWKYDRRKFLNKKKFREKHFLDPATGTYCLKYENISQPNNEDLYLYEGDKALNESQILYEAEVFTCLHQLEQDVLEAEKFVEQNFDLFDPMLQLASIDSTAGGGATTASWSSATGTSRASTTGSSVERRAGGGMRLRTRWRSSSASDDDVEMELGGMTGRTPGPGRVEVDRRSSSAPNTTAPGQRKPRRRSSVLTAVETPSSPNATTDSTNREGRQDDNNPLASQRRNDNVEDADAHLQQELPEELSIADEDDSSSFYGHQRPNTGNNFREPNLSTASTYFDSSRDSDLSSAFLHPTTNGRGSPASARVKTKNQKQELNIGREILELSSTRKRVHFEASTDQMLLPHKLYNASGCLVIFLYFAMTVVCVFQHFFKNWDQRLLSIGKNMGSGELVEDSAAFRSVLEGTSLFPTSNENLLLGRANDENLAGAAASSFLPLQQENAAAGAGALHSGSSLFFRRRTTSTEEPGPQATDGNQEASSSMVGLTSSSSWMETYFSQQEAGEQGREQEKSHFSSREVQISFAGGEDVDEHELLMDEVMSSTSSSSRVRSNRINTASASVSQAEVWGHQELQRREQNRHSNSFLAAVGTTTSTTADINSTMEQEQRDTSPGVLSTSSSTPEEIRKRTSPSSTALEVAEVMHQRQGNYYYKGLTPSLARSEGATSESTTDLIFDAVSSLAPFLQHVSCRPECSSSASKKMKPYQVVTAFASRWQVYFLVRREHLHGQEQEEELHQPEVGDNELRSDHHHLSLETPAACSFAEAINGLLLEKQCNSVLVLFGDGKIKRCRLTEHQVKKVGGDNFHFAANQTTVFNGNFFANSQGATDNEDAGQPRTLLQGIFAAPYSMTNPAGADAGDLASTSSTAASQIPQKIADEILLGIDSISSQSEIQNAFLKMRYHRIMPKNNKATSTKNRDAANTTPIPNPDPHDKLRPVSLFLHPQLEYDPKNLPLRGTRLFLSRQVSNVTTAGGPGVAVASSNDPDINQQGPSSSTSTSHLQRSATTRTRLQFLIADHAGRAFVFEEPEEKQLSTSTKVMGLNLLNVKMAPGWKSVCSLTGDKALITPCKFWIGKRIFCRIYWFPFR